MRSIPGGPFQGADSRGVMGVQAKPEGEGVRSPLWHIRELQRQSVMESLTATYPQPIMHETSSM